MRAGPVIGWIAVLLLVPGVVARGHRAGRLVRRPRAPRRSSCCSRGGAVLAVVVGRVGGGRRGRGGSRLRGARSWSRIGVVIGPKLVRGRRRRPVAAGRRHRSRSGSPTCTSTTRSRTRRPASSSPRRPTILVLTELTPELLAIVRRAPAARTATRTACTGSRCDGEYEAGIFSVVPVRRRREVHTDGRAARRRRDRRPARRRGAGGRRAPRGADEPRRVPHAGGGSCARLRDAARGGRARPRSRSATSTPARCSRRTRRCCARSSVTRTTSSGRSLAPSWGVAPSLPRWVPTFVARLDHLLVGPAVAVVEVSHDLDPVGSDHEPFVRRPSAAAGLSAAMARCRAWRRPSCRGATRRPRPRRRASRADPAPRSDRRRTRARGRRPRRSRGGGRCSRSSRPGRRGAARW